MNFIYRRLPRTNYEVSQLCRTAGAVPKVSLLRKTLDLFGIAVNPLPKTEFPRRASKSPFEAD